MADENDDLEDNETEDDDNTNEETDDSSGGGKLSKEHEALLKQMVADQLKSMKANVDKAYKKLDELTKENTRLKADASDKQRKQLESDGKHLEASRLRVTELEEQLKISNERLTKLSRDRELDSHLGSLDFRNDVARETAFTRIIQDLVQDDDGSWVHSSGASIADYIKSFAKDPNNDFFFKPKENNGAGTSSKKLSAAAGKRPAKISGLTTEELLKLAEEGRLGSFGNY